MKVLKPYIDNAGKLKRLAINYDGWLPENALKIMENALTYNNNKIDAVVVPQRCHRRRGCYPKRPSAQGLAESRDLSGTGCRSGWRKTHYRWHPTMTVYKTDYPTGQHGGGNRRRAGEWQTTESRCNAEQRSERRSSTPAHAPVKSIKRNIDATVVKDGFHKKSELVIR